MCHALLLYNLRKYGTLKLLLLAYGIHTHSCVFSYSFMYAKDRSGKRDKLFTVYPTGRLVVGLILKLSDEVAGGWCLCNSQHWLPANIEIENPFLESSLHSFG